MKQKIKLGIILGVEFVAIAVILILIFFAGKKTYKVTFDLNGGTLISGDLEQVVTQGKSATPPTVAKDGCYLHSWSASYKQITRDVVIKAVWEWQTSVGFDFISGDDSNYCEITGCFRDLTGDVYVGVYHDNKKVLGIRDEAFRDRDGITYVHMLDGILSIGESVFRDCDSLVAVELPGTLTKLGKYAFMNCVSLEKVVIPDTLTVIPEGAFKGCTSLREIVIPAGVKTIENGAFEGCTSLEKVTFLTEEYYVIDGELVKADSLTDKKDSRDDLEDTEYESVYKGIAEIGAYAFKDCSSLTEVILPLTLEKIGEYAFDNDELTVKTPLAEKPEGWAENWCRAVVIWGYVEPTPETEDEKHSWLDGLK